jgi:hypothetical protein
MSNPEQEFYDSLKKKSVKELVDRAEDIEISMNDQEIELNMIRNLLINRGEEIPEHFITDFEYHRFYRK